MKQIVILLILISPFSLLAQTNYQRGYVVKNTGDTLKGYINYRDWSRTPKTIEFKSGMEDRKSVQFSADNLKAFGMDGLETYISYTGLVSMAKNEFPDIPSEEDTTVAKDTIFLKQLVTGKHLALYVNDDAIKTRYFIAAANSGPVELKYFEYYDQYHRVVNSAVFKGQLLLYANNYAPQNKTITGKIETSTFRRPDLESIVAIINDNKIARAGNRSNKFFAGFALEYTKATINNINLFSSSGPSSVTGVMPKISVGYDFFDNPNVQQFAFRVELSFSFQNPKFDFPVQIGGQNTYFYYTFSQFTTSFAPQFLFNFYNKDNFKAFLAVGASLNISVYPLNKYSVQDSDPSVVAAYTRNQPFDLEPLWASIPLQGGVTINKNIQLFYIYDITFSSFARSAAFGYSTNTMDLGVRYLFGNK